MRIEIRHLLNRERPGLTLCGRGALRYYDRGLDLCPKCERAAKVYRKKIKAIRSSLAEGLRKACDVDPYRRAR